METNEQKLTTDEVSEKDTVITIVLEGATSIPKAVNFSQVNAFQLLAIGEWLQLKGRQMIVASETAELNASAVPEKILKP